jgi:hypothetical protein
VLRRFPQSLFLNLGSRFFSTEFFHWQTPDKDHLQFVGQWSGLKSLANPELSVLPWLLLLLIGISFWKKPRYRLALGILIAVILGQLLFLSFAISCLARMQADLTEVINFSIGSVGRYFYPFFTACFLGVIFIWITDRSTRPSPAAPQEKPSAPSQITSTTRSKKRR